MARLARVIAPGLPHHVTQRGNRRQQTFFCDEDYQSYIHLMSEWCGAHEVEIWAYCLMPNHVHLIAVPHLEDGLRHAVGEVHRRYTRMVNFREGWRGHLWQGRFASFVLDEPYLLKATRYIELNPVRAGLITHRAGTGGAAPRRMCGDGTTHWSVSTQVPPFPDSDSLRITSSTLNLAGFWRMGNSLNVLTQRASTAVAG